MAPTRVPTRCSDAMVTTHADRPLDAPAAPPVFISYSSKQSDVADAVRAHLQAAGIACWLAPRNIPIGDAYADAIVEAIHGARVMVLLFSPAADESRAVHNEVELAFNRGIPILPLIVEEATPSRGMRFFLNSRQWRAAFTGPLPDSLRALEADVKQRLSADPRLDTPRRVWRRTLNQLGGPTLVFLATLGAIGALLLAYRAALVPAERWLAGTALVAALVCWMLVRWRGVFERDSKVVATKVVVTAIVIGAWAASAMTAHRVPVIAPGRMGILVARISGEGDLQKRLVVQFRDLAETSSAMPDSGIEVALLPRRLASPADARRAARDSGAMVVVWGAVDSGHFRARVTMGNGEGIYDAAGPIIADNDLAVDETTGFVQEVLIGFVRAYRVYERKNYAAALRMFDDIVALLRKHPETARKEFTPVQAAMSTVLFYAGTARYHLFLDRHDDQFRDDAIRYYREASSYTTANVDDDVSAFVTPVANLAGILLSSGAPGDRDDAADLLERTACESTAVAELTPIPCLYIEYQRGVLDNYSRRYEQARTKFDHLLTVSWPAAAAAVPAGSPHRLLLAYTYRNRAYSLARLADRAPTLNQPLYEQADSDWREAEARFRELRATLPANQFLTRARIDAGKKRIKESKAALAIARAGGNADPDVHLVAAAIAACEGDTAAGLRERINYITVLRRQLTDRDGEFQELKRDADAQWTAFADLCRVSQ